MQSEKGGSRNDSVSLKFRKIRFSEVLSIWIFNKKMKLYNVLGQYDKTI